MRGTTTRYSSPPQRTNHRVDVARVVAQYRRDAQHHLVAGVVSVVVVDLFEVVDVAQHDCRALVAALRQRRLLQHLQSVAAVGQAGQRIGRCLFEQRARVGIGLDQSRLELE